MADLKLLEQLATKGTQGTGMASSERLLKAAEGIKGQDTNFLAAVVGGAIRGKGIKASREEENSL